MRGELTLRILQGIADAAGGIADYVAALLGAGYGASARKIDYEFSKRRRARERDAAKSESESKIRHRYYMLLYQLKKQGLIAESDRESKELSLTLRGYRRLEKLRERSKNSLPSSQYERADSPRVVIVAFDVPERDRGKRAWLRAVLKNLGLKMVQRSVWVGKCKIPRPFLDDLMRLRLIEHVEIFEVTKSGSLSHVL